MEKIKSKVVFGLKWLSSYTKTDMVYLVKGSFWINANTIITNGLAFVLSILFAHFVSKETYGTYQFIISMSGILGGLTLMGMNNAVTGAVARGFDGTLRASIAEQMRFLYIPLLVGFAGAIYYLFFNNTTLSLSFALIAVLLPVGNAFNTWTAFISGKKDFKNLFVYNQIVNVFYYGGLITIVYLIPNTIPLVIGTFFISMCVHIYIYLHILKKYKPDSLAIDTDAILYGKKLSVSNILPLIAIHIDNLIVFHFLGPIQLAVYAFASNIPERLGGLIRPISTVAFPKLANKNQNEISQTLPLKTKQLFVLSMVGGVLYIISAPFIFSIFFSSYMSSVVYSQAYAVIIVLSVTSSLPLTALFATRSPYIFRLNVYHPIYSIILICGGAYLYGIWGIIGAKIISGTLLLVQSSIYSQKQ